MSTTNALILEKGHKIDLTKGTGLSLLNLGLGWDVNSTESNPFDLDAFAICCRNGKTSGAGDILYFNSPKVENKPTILNGALIHSGDNLTGQGEGDDEVISIDLSKVPAEVTEIHVAVNIYRALERKQNFGQVKNAFCRLWNKETGEEMARYDLSEDYSANSAVLFGTIYRKDSEWKFSALGEGKNGDISTIAGTYN